MSQYGTLLLHTTCNAVIKATLFVVLLLLLIALVVLDILRPLGQKPNASRREKSGKMDWHHLRSARNRERKYVRHATHRCSAPVGFPSARFRPRAGRLPLALTGTLPGRGTANRRPGAPVDSRAGRTTPRCATQSGGDVL